MENRERPNPGHGEKTDPLDTESGAEGNTRCGQPEPPRALESCSGPQFLLVREAAEGQCSQGSKENERRVQENQARLSSQRII